MSQQRLVRSLLFLLSAISFLGVNNAEVVDLTDATFEHQTQASTGATTGSWLILFRAPMCQSCSQIRSDLEELSQDADLYERGIVLGSVDAVDSPQTADRFEITNAPTVIYIHRKQVYTLQSGENFSQEALKGFVLEDFAAHEGRPVPAVPSAMEKFMDGLVNLRTTLEEKGGSATIAILGVAVVTLMGVIAALVVTLVTDGGSKKKKKNA